MAGMGKKSSVDGVDLTSQVALPVGKEIDPITPQAQILQEQPIDWVRYHLLTSQTLKLLPKTRLMHKNINNILDITDIRTDKIPDLYYKKGAYIYAILNTNRLQTQLYIGQTGMQRTRANHTKPWTELERAPLQRFQEHIMQAMKSKRHLQRRLVHSTEKWHKTLKIGY